jgi:hypothetical protein
MMKELELTAAEFYQACGEVWIIEKDFWTTMGQSELKHAQNIDLMIKIFSEKPEQFQLGHPFKRPAIQTFISGLKSDIQRLRSQELSKGKTLFVARDIEGSILESKYMEIIRTNEPEFQTLMKQMLLDTVTHKEWLNEKIRQSNLHPA